MTYENLQKDVDRLTKENLELRWKVKSFKDYTIIDHLKIIFNKIRRVF